MPNTIPPGILDDLKRDEGLRLRLYRCPAGKVSIGVGRNLEDNGIRSDEAELMLRNDVLGAMADLDRAVPWWRLRTLDQQRALINLCFAMGLPVFLTFRRLLAALQAGNGKEAATELLASKWAQQVGQERADRIAMLLRR